MEAVGVHLRVEVVGEVAVHLRVEVHHHRPPKPNIQQIWKSKPKTQAPIPQRIRTPTEPTQLVLPILPEELYVNGPSYCPALFHRENKGI